MKRLNTLGAGFTIIEVMVVLGIAATILLIVFLAVPTLERDVRNHKRDADASLLAEAVNECLVNHSNSPAACIDPANIPLPTSSLSIYTGFHYGSSCGLGCTGTQVPPTPDEPNWLFGLKCDYNGGHPFNFIVTGDDHMFVVTYTKESGGGPFNHCIDG